MPQIKLNQLGMEVANTISNNFTTTAGTNTLTPGPITIADGVTVTIVNDSTWTIINV